MSIIPKIKVGFPAKRAKLNLSFDCSTTSNIGNIQPTMCREMVPNETFKVKQASLIRLASMPTPTFGRLSMRNYHVFIPYKELWQQFDAFLSGQHYRSNSTVSYIPEIVPNFDYTYIRTLMLAYSDVTICPKDDLNNPLVIDLVTKTDEETGEIVPDYESMVEQKDALKAAWAAF